MEKLIRELTLMLLYLTSWTEKTPFGPVRRSWKGYPFETLDELAEEGLIAGSRRAKSVLLTEAGEREARRLLARYGLTASELPEPEGRAARLQKPTERG
ncbi:MAG: DUF6429 family protein [Desulfotomaculales bacterium]